MNVPEVTVVVPTRNRPELLRATLRSVLAQDGVRLAVIVVDDGSDDPTVVRQAVDSAGDARVRLLRYRLSGGLGAACNAGAEKATSEWLAFCRDNYLWAPSKLASQLDAARTASASWVYAGDVNVDENFRVLSGAPPLPPDELVRALARWNAVPAGFSSVTLRTDLFARQGGFDPWLRSAGDWELWLRLVPDGIPAWVRQPLVAHRTHARAMRVSRERLFADISAIQRQHGNPVDWARHHRWLAWDCLSHGQRTAATRHYARAVASGDVISVTRAAAAWLLPRGVREWLATLGRRQDEAAWCDEAQAWLDGLRGARAR